MEKIVFVLVGPPGPLSAQLVGTLRHEVVAAWRDEGAHRIQLNVSDPSLGQPFGLEVAEGQQGILAAVSAWVDWAQGFEGFPALPDPAQSGAAWHGFLVCEAEPRPLPQDHRLDAEGALVGFAQLSALTKPTALSWSQWRYLWQARHTRVALNAQSCFRYVQNLVVRPLTPKAPAYAGFSEECFPSEAATDLHVFFAAVGDDEKLNRHMMAMSDSCDRFMDGSAPLSWTVQYHYD